MERRLGRETREGVGDNGRMKNCSAVIMDVD